MRQEIINPPSKETERLIQLRDVGIRMLNDALFLSCILDVPFATMNEISKRTSITIAAVHKIKNRLLAAGLVEKSENGRTKRERPVVLTVLGQAVLAQLFNLSIAASPEHRRDGGGGGESSGTP